jgi:GntR family transcriptional regulator, rspAB operon transcriptional repressor
MDSRPIPARGLGERQSLAAEAYNSVRERLVRGELLIGQVISRRKLAAEFGMSLPPITEALKRLENEGLLETRPRAGTRVRVPTRQAVAGHYVLREALEVQAAMLFARYAERDERLEVLKLAKRVDAVSAQLGSDRFAFAVLHHKLHLRIAELAHCPELFHAISNLYAVAATWLCGTTPPSQFYPPFYHQDLMKVLTSANPATAGESMREHVQFTKDGALVRLEVFFRVENEQTEEYPRKARKSSLASCLMPERDPTAASPLAAEMQNVNGDGQSNPTIDK